MQSIFRPAPRREMTGEHSGGRRRDGGLKMGWTKRWGCGDGYGYRLPAVGPYSKGTPNSVQSSTPNNSQSDKFGDGRNTAATNLHCVVYFLDTDIPASSLR